MWSNEIRVEIRRGETRNELLVGLVSNKFKTDITRLKSCAITPLDELKILGIHHPSNPWGTEHYRKGSIGRGDGAHAGTKKLYFLIQYVMLPTVNLL